MRKSISVLFPLAIAACSSPNSPVAPSSQAIATASRNSVSTASAEASSVKPKYHVVAKFDGDSMVNVGVGYDVSQHVYFVVEDANGDSVSASSVKRIDSIWNVFTYGGGTNGFCQVPRSGFTLWCPATNWPIYPPFSYNGYFAIRVQGQHIDFSGVSDADLQDTIHLYFAGVPNSPLSQRGDFDGDSVVRAGRAYNVAKHYYFAIVDQPTGDSVSSVPVVNIPAIQWVFVSGAMPDTLPSCTVAIDVLTLDCPASSGEGFTGYYAVTVQEGSFNDNANPAYRGSFHLYVKSAARHHE